MTLDALAMRSAQREQRAQEIEEGGGGLATLPPLELELVDPEALQRLEEVLEMLKEKDEKIASLQVQLKLHLSHLCKARCTAQVAGG